MSSSNGNGGDDGDGGDDIWSCKSQLGDVFWSSECQLRMKMCIGKAVGIRF